jgi:hypothetical protein
MGDQVELSCRCGEVQARVADASPRTVNHIVCYCDDCQAFAHRLGRADLLDASGGSDIVQVAPNSFTFLQGRDRIAGLRLAPKGLFRWYANCCNTPIGNTAAPSIPFVGIVVPASDPAAREALEVVGPPTGAFLGQYAIGAPPAASRGRNFSLLLRAVVRVLGWRLRGKTWPHPFFEKGKSEPVYPVTVLSREQREALRPLCGPHPAAGAAG